MNNAVKLVDDLKKFISETPELDDAKDLLFVKNGFTIEGAITNIGKIR